MKSPDKTASLLRAIPPVNQLLSAAAFAKFPIAPSYLKIIIQQEINRFRREVKDAPDLDATQVPDSLKIRIAGRLQTLIGRGPVRVINASGIILHTNMGRAPLSEAARQAISETTAHYDALEVDLATGKRGHRDNHVRELLCLLTGAEDALIVNNCAAAILLVLTALCDGKGVPVSRGELVEIGGSFRMPDVMEASGATMVEIGTTNKTHLKDYRQVIGPQTGALLKVHTSNYRVEGFSQRPTLAELLKLAEEHQLPLIYDCGSGHLQEFGNLEYDTDEPLVQDIIASGVDVITFSGDKMLGGPQAGIIAGKKSVIDKIRSHHLLRALRCDKLTYAAMAATLKLYLQPELLQQQLPIAGLFGETVAALQERARGIANATKDMPLKTEIVEATSQVGSGAFPLKDLPSVALKISSKDIRPDEIARRLRGHQPPIIGYIQGDCLLLNLRTVREDEIALIISALQSLST